MQVSAQTIQAELVSSWPYLSNKISYKGFSPYKKALAVWKCEFHKIHCYKTPVARHTGTISPEVTPNAVIGVQNSIFAKLKGNLVDSGFTYIFFKILVYSADTIFKVLQIQI